jgi:hypothetical protein
MCRECDTQCVYQGQLNLALKDMFGVITELSPTFSTELSRLHVFLGKVHHQIPVLFTSVEEVVTRHTVKSSASSLETHST